MAKAYVSFHSVALQSPKWSSVLAPAVKSEVLDFTSAQATTTGSLTSTIAANRDMVASISTDAACYLAVGATPDCTLEAETAASSARFYLGAGASVDLYLPGGAKVAAKAVS